MPPKGPKLTNAQIEALLEVESGSEDEDFDEIFGPGVDLDDPEEGLNQVLPSGSGEGNNQTIEPDENEDF